MMISTWTGPAAWRNVPHVGGDREEQARHEERDQAEHHDRPDGRGRASLPRQRQQPDDRHRDARQDQHVDQVVAEARRCAARPAGAGPTAR